ncbi:hypothetical protein J6590_046021 [Homalodisca vitripennis]|nr:hypothetical protein J6590_046021 [Homalodisca vitripennis]
MLHALEGPVENYRAADISIWPPDDDPYNNTDEDSEDEACRNPYRICRRQLQTEAEFRFEGDIRLLQDDFKYLSAKRYLKSLDYSLVLIFLHLTDVSSPITVLLWNGCSS